MSCASEKLERAVAARIGSKKLSVGGKCSVPRHGFGAGVTENKALRARGQGRRHHFDCVHIDKRYLRRFAAKGRREAGLKAAATNRERGSTGRGAVGRAYSSDSQRNARQVDNSEARRS